MSREHLRKSYCLTALGREIASRPENLGLAEYWSRRYRERAPGLADDILQAAREGMMDAVAHHDPKRGTELSTYASRRIVGSVQNFLRSRHFMTPYRDSRSVRRDDRPRVGSVHTRSHRVPGAGDDSSRGGDGYIPIRDPAPPVGHEIEAESSLSAWMRGFSAEEKFVVRKLTAPDPWMKKDVAAHIGLSPSRVGQIYREVVAELRARVDHPRYRELMGA